MLKKFNSWITVIFKMTISNRAFIALIILIPVLCFAVGKISTMTSADETALIYLYARFEDSFSSAILDELEGEHDGYSFVIADSEEQIETEVSDHTALCGYIFEEDIPERIAAGNYDKNITVVERVGNLKTDIINEMVFSCYYEKFAECYIESEMPSLDTDVFEENYSRYVVNSEFNYTIEQVEEAPENTSSAIYVARNIIAIILCVFGMLLLGSFISDSEKGLLRAVSPNLRLLFRITYFAVPFALLTPLALLGLFLQDMHGGFGGELIDIVLYNLLLIILCTVFSYIVRKRQIVLGLIPVLTVLFIVICPVIADFSEYVPVIGLLRYVCPPYFYIRGLCF